MLDYYVGNKDLVTVTDEKQGESLALIAGNQAAKTPSIWKENRYIPTNPAKLATVAQRTEFLRLLVEKRYLVWAAPVFGCSIRTVYRRMAEDSEFAIAVEDSVTYREETLLARIEAVSEEEALKAGRNTDRIVQLNALAPGKYRRQDRGVQVATQVNITLGYQPPRPPSMRK